MIPTTLFMKNHNEEYLRMSIERKFLFNPIPIKWPSCGREKNKSFGNFSLLKSIHFYIAAFQITFKFLCLVSSLHSLLLPSHLLPAAPASFSPEEKPDKLFLSSCSLFNFFISCIIQHIH